MKKENQLKYLLIQYPKGCIKKAEYKEPMIYDNCRIAQPIP